MQGIGARGDREAARRGGSAPKKVSRLLAFDGRSKAARRIEQLTQIFAAALSDGRTLSPLLRLQIDSVATLTALAEKARSDYFVGKETLVHVTRIEGRVASAIARLGLEDKVSLEPINLGQHLAALAARKTAQRQTAEAAESGAPPADRPGAIPGEAAEPPT